MGGPEQAGTIGGGTDEGREARSWRVRPSGRRRRPAPGPEDQRRLTVAVLGYAMGPVALVVLLLLRQHRLVEPLPVWEYLASFAVVPAASFAVDRLALRAPGSRWRAQLRHAVNAAVVAWITYMTGWGPVLVSGFAIVVVDSCARQGARSWRSTTAWSLAAIAVAQVGVATGVVPSRLSAGSAHVLALLGAVLLVFISRMVGAATAQAEQAHAAARRSEERFRALVQHSSDTTFIVDPDGRVRFVSPAVTSLLGQDPTALVGVVATDLVHPEDRERLDAATAGRFSEAAGGVSEPIELRMAHVDGAWRHAEVVVSDQRCHPAVEGYVCNIRDITERAEAQAILAHRATHDPLTGLPNRDLLAERVQRAAARYRRRGCPPPVLMLLDLDRFKLVNDGLGHQAGDRVLVELADRLRGVVRAEDTVARLGGDEFVLLCEDVADATAALVLAHRVAEVVEAPVTVEGRPCSVGASIGIRVVDDASDVDTLLADADAAMYLAKAERGRLRVRFFDASARTGSSRRTTGEPALARALADHQFVLHYQPVVATADGRVVAAEALLRWDHPDLGLLLPERFLGDAERCGMIAPIGTWVLEEACRQLRTWQRERTGTRPFGVSVNLSDRQLVEPSLVDAVTRSIGGGELAGAVQVTLELVEALVLSDDASVRRNLRRLHDLGARLAIDDFGNGRGGLSTLRELPVDMVKIDRSLVAGIGRSSRDGSIVRAVLAMAADLGVSVTAKGVETPAQLDFLRSAGCPFVQGFLFGQPAAADQGFPPTVVPLTVTDDLPAPSLWA
jgi:diguanylate cyclase (GGDEF)-like protein/PAS domain S-box-containing protein